MSNPPRQAELLELQAPVPIPEGAGATDAVAGSRVDGKISDKKRFENMFAAQLRQYRLPPFETNYKFAQEILFKGADGRVRRRGWMFDVAFPEYKYAIEIEGLVVRKVWSATLIGGGPVRSGKYVVNVSNVEPITVAMGRHATITGFREDTVKYNTATRLGWRLSRFLQTDIKPKVAIEETMRTLASLGWKPTHT